MESKHFTNDELACPCCDTNGIKIGAMEKLELMRLHYGKPMIPNSAYRCMQYNTEKGHSETSSHPKGYAFDIRVNGSVMRLLLLIAAIAAGFRRIGVAKTFIHVDCDPDKPSCLWLYP